MRLLVLFFSFTAASVTAASDSFTIIRDGKEYRCHASGGGGNPNPDAARKCAEAAFRGPFSDQQSIELCQGARDNGPAECGELAYTGPFSTNQSVTLCKGTRLGTGPAICALKAYRGPFSSNQAVELCTRYGTEATADCALEAYRGPYSSDEAVRLCKAGPHSRMSVAPELAKK
jgi:hypothetical protein